MALANLFLGLDDFDRVRDAGDETVARLIESLLRQIDVAPGHFDLLGRLLQIKKCGADIRIDLGTQIFEALAALLQLRIGLDHIASPSFAA